MTAPATAAAQQGDINAAQVLPGDRNHPEYPKSWLSRRPLDWT